MRSLKLTLFLFVRRLVFFSGLRKVRKNDTDDLFFERTHVAISVDIDTVVTEPTHGP